MDKEKKKRIWTIIGVLLAYSSLGIGLLAQNKIIPYDYIKPLVAICIFGSAIILRLTHGQRPRGKKR